MTLAELIVCVCVEAANADTQTLASPASSPMSTSQALNGELALETDTMMTTGHGTYCQCSLSNVSELSHTSEVPL